MAAICGRHGRIEDAEPGDRCGEKPHAIQLKGNPRQKRCDLELMAICEGCDHPEHTGQCATMTGNDEDGHTLWCECKVPEAKA